MRFQTLIAARLLCRHGKKNPRKLMNSTINVKNIALHHCSLFMSCTKKCCITVNQNCVLMLLVIRFRGAKKLSSRSFFINLTSLKFTAVVKVRKTATTKALWGCETLASFIIPNYRVFSLLSCSTLVR